MGLMFWKSKPDRARCSVYLRSDSVTLAFSLHNETKLYEQSVDRPEEWAAALQLLIEQASLTGAYSVVFVLATQLCQQFQIDKPSVPDDELTAAIPWAIKDMVSEAISELVVDYYQATSAPRTAEKLNVVVGRKVLIQQLIDIAEAHSWDINGITIDTMAAISLLEVSDRCQLLLWQSKGGELELLVVRQGTICFSRQLRAFSTLYQMQEIEFTQNFFDSLSLEMQRSMDFVSGTLKLPEVSVIYLSTPSRFNDSIISALQQNLASKVELLTLAGAPAGDSPACLPSFGGLAEGVL